MLIFRKVQSNTLTDLRWFREFVCFGQIYMILPWGTVNAEDSGFTIPGMMEMGIRYVRVNY